jgi:uncharacterized protein (DUF433 family)
MNWEERITLDPKVLVGKPVIRGTRLAVEFIMDLLANNWTEQQILENYPGITHEDISACLHYATEMLKSERVYVTPAKS